MTNLSTCKWLPPPRNTAQLQLSIGEAGVDVDLVKEKGLGIFPDYGYVIGTSFGFCDAPSTSTTAKALCASYEYMYNFCTIEFKLVLQP